MAADYKWRYEDMPSNGMFHVIDRRLAETYSSERVQNRWRVVQLNSGRSQVYPTLGAAKQACIEGGAAMSKSERWWEN